MNRKIPHDAFEYYFSLGADRSYQAVAIRYKVTKRAITKVATKENWQRRVLMRDQKVQTAVEHKAVETLEQMNSRHLRSLKAIQGKALTALSQMPLSTAMDAVRALEISIKQERLIRGEPTDRTKISVEEVIRNEYDRWLDHEG